MGNELVFLQPQPLPGSWYASEIGQLIYVRMVLYIKGHLTHVAFEHVNGKRVFVDWQAWSQMRLELHAQRPKQRGRTRDL